MFFFKDNLCDMTEMVFREIYSQFDWRPRRNQDDVITFDLNDQSAAQVIVQSDNKTYINSFMTVLPLKWKAWKNNL